MSSPRCPNCSHELSAECRFCSACGTPLTLSDPPTTGTYRPLNVSLPPDAAPTAPLKTGRFPPGHVLAGRYRVVSRIGKGGMGEVYRAEDLRLSGSVALKFLPASLSADPDRQRRLNNEVRVARLITHPNVCRVFDIAEADGESFITMEFIDGQTLGALLRQAGRLPQDRGLEIARQLCQGLAAAHERGVIHRDLKPHNVMLDATGRVKITDFGLASEAENVHGSEVRHGTPAYMAPEQMLGEEVSVQSDLFSLGLILYEVFTGRPAFPATTPQELRRLHEAHTPVKPSSHLTGVDPAVERVILRCLERSPKDRPRSAQAVLAALPGGDPLAQALAAGETPSPEMLANADVEGKLKPWAACALLTATLTIVATIAVLADVVKYFRRVPFESSPEQMTFLARQLLRRVAYADPPADSTWGFAQDAEYQQYLNTIDPSAGRWAGLVTGRPAIHYFWYRQSPYLLDAGGSANAYGIVTPTAPPNSLPGMVTLFLDPEGRLIEFHAVAPSDLDGKEVGWTAMFEAAELDPKDLKPDTPQHPPIAGADAQFAWVGTFPERPDVPLRVEAASSRGVPVYFFVSTEGRDRPRLLASGGQRNQGFRTVFEIGRPTLALLVCGVLAVRNFRRGRVDVRGGLRLGLLIFTVTLAAWIVRAHHTFTLNLEYTLLIKALGQGLLFAAALSLPYAAIEPHLRRIWPWQNVAWSRVLTGRFGDPMVGRDLLIGCLLGALMALLNLLQALTCEALALPSDIFFPQVRLETFALTRLPHFFCIAMLENSLFQCFIGISFLFLLSLLFRRLWLASLVYAGIWTVLFLSGPDYPHPVNATFVILRCAIVLGFMLRFGVVAIVSFGSYWVLLAFGPITYDLRTWYAASTVVTMMVLVALPSWGFWIAKAGQPVLAGWLDGE